MERLRQEVLVLQGRILSQEEIIDALQNELKQSNVQRWSLENEFKAYRQKMQDKLMCLMEERAKEWIDDVARGTSQVSFSDTLSLSLFREQR